MKNFMYCVCILLVGLFMASCSDNDACPECELLPEVGPCNAAIPIYYFDADSNKCVQFIWGGCAGVVPFETLEACEACGCEN